MTVPLVSIVIPAKGQAHFLSDAINSALRQTATFEIIVVAGDDASERVAASFGVRVFRAPGNGRAFALNVGIEASIGKYIVTLDSDDKLAPDYTAQTCATANPSRCDNIVSTGVQVFGNGAESWSSWYDPRKILTENGLHCASMFDKALWVAVGGFDVATPSSEDWEMWVRMSRLKPLVRVLNDRLFHWRRHGNNTSNVLGYSDIHHAICAANPTIYGVKSAAWSLEWLKRNASPTMRDRIRQRYEWFPANEHAKMFFEAVK